MQKPDLPSSKSPHQSPVIPTETPKEKKLYRRVFSKEFLGLRKDSSKRSVAPVAAESSAQGKARESYEEQERRLLTEAARMGGDVHQALGRDFVSAGAEGGAESGGGATHAVSTASDIGDMDCRSDGSDRVSDSPSMLRGSAEAFRLGASTSSFGMTPSASCESPAAFQQSSSQAQSAHVSSDPSKLAESSPVPQTEQQTRSSGNDADPLGGDTSFSLGESARERRRRQRMLNPLKSSTILRVLEGGPRDLEEGSQTDDTPEPATPDSTTELDVGGLRLIRPGIQA